MRHYRRNDGESHKMFLTWLPHDVRAKVLARDDKSKGLEHLWWIWFTQGEDGTIHKDVRRTWETLVSSGGMHRYVPTHEDLWKPWHEHPSRIRGHGLHDFESNPGDRGLRRHARRAAASGTVEDLVRLAHERRRRGEPVDPWELVPLSYTFLDAYKDLAGHQSRLTGVAGRVEAFRLHAFRPWDPESKADAPERFYVAPAAYPIYPPARPSSEGYIEEREREIQNHLAAVEKWRYLGAIVVRLEFDAEGEHAESGDCGKGGHADGRGGCSYCTWIGAYRWRVLTRVKDLRNALGQSGWWSSGTRNVVLPQQWEWARIMKRVGKRWKNNPRRELRVPMPRALYPAKTMVLPLDPGNWRSNPVLPCNDPCCMCAGRGHACAGCGGSDKDSCSCGRCDRCRRLVRGVEGHAPLFMTEDDEALCGRCHDND